MRIKEIRDMSSEERTKRLGEIKIELTRLKTMIKAGGTVENPARVKELRRAVAKLLTIENEEKLGLVRKPKEKPKAQKQERRRGRKRNESDVRDN
jgi:large subunit ribosomal protein L29